MLFLFIEHNKMHRRQYVCVCVGTSRYFKYRFTGKTRFVCSQKVQWLAVRAVRHPVYDSSLAAPP